MLRNVHLLLCATGALLLSYPLGVTRPAVPALAWRDHAGLATGLACVIAVSLLATALPLRRRPHLPAPGHGRFLRRSASLLMLHDGPAPIETLQLQDDGHCVVRNVFTPGEVAALRSEVLDVFESFPPDGRPFSATEEQGRMYRYQMFNRSPLSQRALEHRRILDVIEPLLGDDCHVIANTAWRNPPRQATLGQDWHTDAGPHVPRSPDIEWPEGMPYPIFVIGVHVYLEDCGTDDGPTGVIPGSHRSGQPPPPDRRWDDALSYRGRSAQSHIVKAGDVGMFVSDVWHRRMPASDGGKGRLFLQINYGRRDIAQRILLSREFHQASPEAVARAATQRQQQLIGIHPAHFYDG